MGSLQADRLRLLISAGTGQGWCQAPGKAEFVRRGKKTSSVQAETQPAPNQVPCSCSVLGWEVCGSISELCQQQFGVFLAVLVGDNSIPCKLQVLDTFKPIPCGFPM